MSASRGPSIASHKSKPEGDVLEAFKVFDEKGKGYLTTAELKKVLQMGGVIEEQELNTLVETADPRGEGSVYYEQFLGALFKRHPDLFPC